MAADGNALRSSLLVHKLFKQKSSSETAPISPHCAYAFNLANLKIRGVLNQTMGLFQTLFLFINALNKMEKATEWGVDINRARQKLEAARLT